MRLLVAAFLGFLQQVLVVAPQPGPGVFSTTIQAAVDAAGEGDIVLVKPGTYAGFVLFRKSITVAAEAGADVTLRTGIRIYQLEATQRVVLQRLRVDVSGGPSSFPAVYLAGDAGPVWLDRCSIQGGSSPFKGGTGTGVDASVCASVVLERCDVRGGRNWFLGASVGAPGVFVEASTVHVHDGDLRGGDAAPATGGFFAAPGGPGVHVSTGLVYLSGSHAEGGAGGAGTAPGSSGGPGGSGLAAFAQAVVVDSTFAGGAGGAGGPGGSPGPPGVATNVGFGGSLTTFPGAARHFVAESPVREQQSSAWTAGGAPGEIAAAIVSAAPAAGPLLPAFGGPLLVDASSAFVHSLGTIPASGMLSVPIPIPDLPPSMLGGTVFLQSFFFAPPGAVSLGPVSALVVLDQTL